MESPTNPESPGQVITFWDSRGPNQYQERILDAVHSHPIYLNQSRVQLFNNCHRKFYWWHVEGLEPDRPRWALDIGTSVHHGLALLGSGEDIDKVVEESRKKLASLMPKRILPGDFEELQSNQDVVEKLLRGYYDEYKETTWVPIAQETKGTVEVGEGTRVYLVFRTDKLATWNSRLWIVDHKTAGKLDLRDLAKYEMALQFSAYQYAVTKFTRQAVAGVIVDILVKTKTPQYHRDLKTRSPKELIEFEKEFTEIGKEIAWRLQRINHGEDPMAVFYKNTDECFRYGTCPYRELCMEDNETRRLLYKQRTPDYVDAPNQLSIDSMPEGR